MELRQIRYFLAVAESRHFTKAAEALGISQSNLSAQVKELERDLGAPLFDRAGRSVRLSAAGEAFLEPARRTLREAASCKDAVDEVIGAKVGRVRVGATHVFSTRLIPDVVLAFLPRYPAIDLSITKAGGLAVRHGVVSGRFDVGISYTTRPAREIEQELEAEPLLVDELVVVAPPGHALAGRGPLKLADLHEVPLALTDFECSSRRRLDRLLEEGGIHPRILVEINDMHAILEIVRRGACASVLPRQSIIDPAGLILVEIDDPRVTLPAALLWRRGAYRSPAATAFRDVIFQVESGRFPPRRDPD